MKNSLKTLWIPLLFLCYLKLTVASEVSEHTIRLTTGEWAPYISESLSNYGLISQIVVESFAYENVKVEYSFFPWARSYKLARDGQWDGSIAWYELPERKEHFHISDSVYETDFHFFHLKTNKFKFRNINDLKNMKVGGVIGSYYGEIFDTAENNELISVYRSRSELNVLRMLFKKRVDLVPMDPITANYSLRNLLEPSEIKPVTYHQAPILSRSLHLILSKKSKNNMKMLALFNQGLSRLRESGRYDLIISESGYQ